MKNKIYQLFGDRAREMGYRVMELLEPELDSSLSVGIKPNLGLKSKEPTLF